MTSEQEFEQEVRTFTGYSQSKLPDDDLSDAKRRAEKHIRSRKSGLEEDFDLLSNEQSEEALFWYTCLFVKVATGELDSKTVQIGAIDSEKLLAKADGDVTEWFRRARTATRNFRSDQLIQSSSPVRNDRSYPSQSPRGYGSGPDI